MSSKQISYNMLDSGAGVTSSSPVSAPSQQPIIPAISSLKFPFNLTKDQTEAVEAWMTNGYRGSIIYSTGTGKTEIAFECAKRAYESIKHTGKSTNTSDNDSGDSPFNILFLVPRIILVQQNINRLIRYGIPQEKKYEK
jgi:superfamily II DNA or RNA helicase